MINRYSITANAELVASRFSIEVPNHYQPRYNASPSQLLPVITASGRQGISWFYWGRPPQFAHNKPLGEKSINQSVETLQDKPTLKKTVFRNRCIIPADGWYAWKKIGKKTQVPHRFVTADQNLFSFAGVWEEFEDETGSMLHTFMIITVPANETVSTVAERMPVIFDKQMEEVWLHDSTSEKELVELLIPYSASKISAYTVSPRINDPLNEHASLILHTPSSDQHGNLTLFD